MGLTDEQWTRPEAFHLPNVSLEAEVGHLATHGLLPQRLPAPEFLQRVCLQQAGGFPLHLLLILV